MERSNIRILLTGTNRWALAARLAIGLNEAGCEIFALCPSGPSAIAKTRVVRQLFRYSGLDPLNSLRSAIESCQPDLVIPTCDRGVEHLHELHAKLSSDGPKGRVVSQTIERSLGPASGYSVLSSRYDFMALAQRLGIMVPAFARLASEADLATWRTKHPFPWVMKADGTWGGQGVRIVDSIESASAAFADLPKMFKLSRGIKRMVVNRDSFWLRPWWNHTERAVMVQSYVFGRAANCTAVCWNGQVLGLIAVEVIRSDGATGPASIVRLLESQEMKTAATKIAEALDLSGFFGLDFMIEDATNAHYLIEINPRPTPPCYLRLGTERDLPGALWAQLSNEPMPESEAPTQNPLIAYFPQALSGNADILEQCYTDLPENEPELVQELFNPFPDRTMFFRLVQWFARRRAGANGDATQHIPLKLNEDQASSDRARIKPIDSAVDKFRMGS